MKIVALILAVLLVVGLPMACAKKEESPEGGTPPKVATPDEPDEPETPENPPEVALDGKKIMESSCVSCHSVDKVTGYKSDHGGWSHQVEVCTGEEPLEEAELKVLLDYLAENHGH